MPEDAIEEDELDALESDPAFEAWLEALVELSPVQQYTLLMASWADC